MTMLRRSGSGRNRSGNDSHVRRPMMTGDPDVARWKYARSSGTCQGMPPSAPSTPPRACAQIARSVTASDRHCGADRRVVLVADEREVVVVVLEDARRLRDLERRVRERVARELLGDLLAVVVGDVAVAAGPDELARRDPRQDRNS